MSCIFKTKYGQPSKLHEELISLVGPELAELEYARVYSDEFQNWFSPYSFENNMDDANDNIPMKNIDEQGLPKLKSTKDGVGYYFENHYYPGAVRNYYFGLTLNF